jgi:hypothetical protein
MDTNNAIFLLKSVDTTTVPEQELRNLVLHLQNQMNNIYTYLIGEWNNGHRARSTRNGQFVSADEVKQYLDGN